MIIPLSKGKFTIVDDEDFEFLTQWKWRLSGEGYAYRGFRKNGKNMGIFMHRVINKTPEGLFTDHINMDRLDNRKSNLRTVGKRMNSINRDKQKNNTSGYKGVRWDKHAKKWNAYLHSFGKKHYLGNYKDINDAIKARKEGETKYYAIS